MLQNNVNLSLYNGFAHFLTLMSQQKLTENRYYNILLMLITWLILPAGFEGEHLLIFSLLYISFLSDSCLTL